ncbi:MAG: pectate lyase [Verrucomicrobiaceae bacterium]|nr:pectate lyase [Verrucomicrobiaceae bacterium]
MLGVLPAAAQDKPKPSIKLNTTTDFVAIHVKATAPRETTALEYRFVAAGAIVDDSPWLPVNGKPDDDGAYAFDVKLETARWSELQVRALNGTVELVRKETHSKVSHDFEWLKPERIEALPEVERTAWQAYMKRSLERSEREYEILASECRKLSLAQARPAPGNRAELELDSDIPLEWFSSAEAIKTADAVLSYQTPSGGWSKAVDYSSGPREPGTHWTSQKGDAWHYCGTIDNRCTTEQIKLLAGVATAMKREDAKGGAIRGIEYLLEAQYPNGGWPQNYPVESGYHEAITLNDNAMVHVLEVLSAISSEKPAFAFVDDALRQRAQAALDKGIACILAMQVNVDGKLTVWGAQHEPLTLAPAHARSKEPPSLSGGESAELLKFLMRSGPLTAEVKTAIEAGVAWLDAHRITGLRKTTNEKGKTDYVADAGSSEVYWARFYDVTTGKAIFPGSDDGILYSTFTEMAAKNKVAYDFLTTKARDVIGKEVTRWQKRITKAK